MYIKQEAQLPRR